MDQIQENLQNERIVVVCNFEVVELDERRCFVVGSVREFAL